MKRFEREMIRGWLHEPSTASVDSGAGPAVRGDGLVITHGAGGNCDAPLIRAIATAFADAGYMVLRCDLPFRQVRPHGPPFPAQAETDREGLRRAAEAMRELAAGRLILSGHSYGGRQATMLAADLPNVADRLLLLSYPLHPPAKPTQLRTAHFPQLRTPSLFFQGTKDSFGSIDEMRAALALIPARTELVAVEGEGHGLSAKVARTCIERLEQF